MARAVAYTLVMLGLLACSSTTEVPQGNGTDGGCAVGGAGCPCTEQGVCDPGLICVEDIDTCAVKEDCNVGAPGCECTEGGQCDDGYVCMEDVCVSDDPCNPEMTGSEGCQCTMGGGCDEGLECLSGTCVTLPAGSSGSGGSSSSGEATTSSTGEVDGGGGRGLDLDPGRDRW
jgi:hypothetical protein